MLTRSERNKVSVTPLLYLLISLAWRSCWVGWCWTQRLLIVGHFRTPRLLQGLWSRSEVPRPPKATVPRAGQGARGDWASGSAGWGLLAGQRQPLLDFLGGRRADTDNWGVPLHCHLIVTLLALLALNWATRRNARTISGRESYVFSHPAATETPRIVSFTWELIIGIGPYSGNVGSSLRTNIVQNPVQTNLTYSHLIRINRAKHAKN